MSEPNRRPRKPPLTKRVLQGIILIEIACGGRAEPSDLKGVMTKRDYTKAIDAIDWAKRRLETYE